MPSMMAGSPSLRIDLDLQGPLCILRMKGRFLTGHDLDYLRTKIEEVKNTGCRKVLADLHEVPYLDSTGIGFVVGLYTSVKNAGGQFALLGLNRRVREVLEITKLSEIIPSYENEALARRAVLASI